MRYDGIGEGVPHVAGEGLGNKAAKHETASGEAGDVALTALLVGVLEEVDFVVGLQHVKQTTLVVVVAHAGE